MTESLLDPSASLPIPQADPNKNYVEELVGDGKKFKTVEDLARGKYEADLHVALKNRELDELNAQYLKLREEYNAGPKLQELIDQITSAKPSTSTAPPQENVESKAPFDSSQIESLISNKITEVEESRRRQANFETVKEKLQERFGDDFKRALATQTQKLGLTADKVDDLARTSPQAFMKLMELDKQPVNDTFQSPPRSSQRTDTFAPVTNKRTWSYYKNLQKTQPDLFSDSKAHNQMMADIKAIGEQAFYDIS